MSALKMSLQSKMMTVAPVLLMVGLIVLFRLTHSRRHHTYPACETSVAILDGPSGNTRLTTAQAH